MSKPIVAHGTEDPRERARRILAARFANLGHELIALAREIDEVGEIEPAAAPELSLRELAALRLAASRMWPAIGKGDPEGAVEIACNPHRITVEVLPREVNGARQ
ncbi:hypothetical protein [Oceanithermus sp.]